MKKMKKQIKIVPVCKHENTDINVSINTSHIINGYYIIDKPTTLKCACKDCGTSYDEVCTAGYYKQ